MEKSNKESGGVCEKIYNAVTGNSAIRAVHRKSGRSQSPKVIDLSPLVTVPQKAQQKPGPAAADVNIQIHSDQCSKRKLDDAKSTTVFLPIEGPEDKGVHVSPANPKPPVPFNPRQEGKAVHDPGSDKFSLYISEVKNKMRSPSNVGDRDEIASPATRSATRRDSFNDRVANYIHRAKNNFITPSNAGDSSSQE